jgi:hypothetical protein
MTAEVGPDQLVGVVDDAHGGNGKEAQVGADQQGLGVRVADAADAAGAVEFGHVLLELGSKGCIFDVMDLALEAVLLIVNDHAPPAGAQVGVVVHAEKEVENAVVL